MSKKINRRDKTLYGLIIGLILPLVTFFIVYLVSNNQISFLAYLEGLWKINALVKVLSLCFLLNFITFMYFIKRKWDMAARGVLMATILYTIFVLFTQLI